MADGGPVVHRERAPDMECGRQYWFDGESYQKREPDDAPHKYDHIEAFCLMEYRCDDCGFTETYWNSRDGVTPFGRRCPECSGMNMLHHDWRSDVYAPDHIPKHGQGIWVDMPESLKRPHALPEYNRRRGPSLRLRPKIAKK